jgi:hypothetical protein
LGVEGGGEEEERGESNLGKICLGLPSFFVSNQEMRGKEERGKEMRGKEERKWRERAEREGEVVGWACPRSSCKKK